MARERPRPHLDDLESGPSAARELFQDDDQQPEPTESRPTSRPFTDHLRSTPAAPLGDTEKALLWVAGIIVTALFAYSLYKVAG